MAASGFEDASDEELVRAFTAEGNHDALEALLKRHQNSVYGLAYRILGNRDDALDATQDVFIAVFRKARSFRYEAAFATWLYRLTVNACRDLNRKRARTPTPVAEIEAPTSSHLESAEGRLEAERLLRLLPEDQRAVALLRDLYGLSYQEISEATGVPLGTVKSRLARARMALADALAEPPSELNRLTEQK